MKTADEKIIASIIAVPTILRGNSRRDSKGFILRLGFRVQLYYVDFQPLNLPLCVMHIDFCTDKTINTSQLSVVCMYL